MPANYVSILVKSNDQAKPDMDALKARLAELSHQTADARVNVVDADSAAKLDALKAKLLDLDKRTANPKITMTSAIRAEAQVHAVEAQLEKLGQSADDAGGHLDRLNGKVKGSGAQAQTASSRFGALRSAVNLFVTGGLSGGIADMTAFQKAMAAMNFATGVGEPLMAGLTVAAGGLASGLAAAGAGLGVFGLVAKGVWGQVSNAVKAFQTAQSTTGKASAAAMKQYQAYMGALTGSQRQLVGSVNQAEGAWQSFINKNTSGVAAIMSKGIGLLPKVFASMQPFLVPVEKALSGIIGQLGKGLSSSGFTSFIDMMAKNAGPAITKLSAAIGHIVVGIGGILKAFMPVSQGVMGGLDKMTEKFAHWGQTLPSHSGFQSLMAMFRTDTPLVISALQKLGGVAKIVIGQMTGMSSFGNSKMFLQVANSVLGFADALLKAHPQLVYLLLYAKLGADGLGKLKTAFAGVGAGVAGIKKVGSAMQDLNAGFSNSSAAAHDATGAWGTFGGKLSSLGTTMKSAFSSIGSGLASAASSVAQFAAQTGRQLATAARATVAWVAEHAAAAATFIAENVAMAVSATAAFIAENAATLGLVVVIAALIAAIIYLATHWKQAWGEIKKIAEDAWHAISAAFNSVKKDVTEAISTVIDFVREHWKLILSILTGPVGAAVIWIVSHWNQIVDGTRKMVGDVISFFKSLPGKILSAVSNFGRLLWNAGEDLLRGLIGGIKSMVGDVVGEAENIGHSILSGIKGALGIGSPSRITFQHGRWLAQGLINGMASMNGDLVAQSRRMGTAAVPSSYGAGGGYGAAAAGAPAKVQIEWVGSAGGDELMQFIRKNVRARSGGNVQQALGVGG